MRARILSIAILMAAGVGAPQFALAQSAAPLFDWSGFYVGANLGYGSGHALVGPTNYTLHNKSSTIPAFNFDLSGLMGGGEAGVFWKENGMLFGLQADINATNVGGGVSYPSNFDLHATLNWLATQRLQVGVPMDRLLYYGSIGVAEGGIRADLRDHHNNAGTIVGTSSSSTNVGFVVGGGVAAALSPHWIAKAEYLHADLGSQGYTFREPAFNEVVTSRARTTYNIVRFVLDYRF